MNPLTYLPASARRWVYFAVAAAVLIVGAAAAYYGSIQQPAPQWVAGALGALGFVGGAIGLMAGTNTTDPVAELDDASPTGAVAGPASALPEGTPVDVEAAAVAAPPDGAPAPELEAQRRTNIAAVEEQLAADGYTGEHRPATNIIHLDGSPS